MSISAAAVEEFAVSLSKASFSSDDERRRAAVAALKLANELETPHEKYERYGFSEPALEVALKIGCDVGLFSVLGQDASAAVSANNLAIETGVNEYVVRRVCKHLAAMDVIDEAGEHLYSPTDSSRALASREWKALVNNWFGGYISGLRALPEWLAQHKYELPTSVNECPWQAGIGQNTTFWDFFRDNPARGEDFNLLMQGLSSERKSAIELYPVQERLVEGFQGGTFIIDVGGGTGHDLRKFAEKHPIPNAEYVLQDLEEVIANAVVEHPVKAMAHDFFTTQPIQGPRATFLKQIIHEWPDDKCIEILSNLLPAMKPGYTKLLIHDVVIPPTNATPLATGMDLTMMSLFGAKERTLADFRSLIEAADLELENVWSGPAYRDSLLEIVRRQ